MNSLPDLAQPDSDPRLWLEEIEGREALAWVESETARTLRRFADARFEADRDVLAAILDRPDKIPYVRRRGGYLYNFWVDAAQPRGLWRRTTTESYRAPAPEWEIIVDIDVLAAGEGEDWIWGGASTLPGSHERAILSLSRGGMDAVVLREFDIPTKRFVANGFALPQAKQGAAWVDRDTLLIWSTLGDNQATASGYPRTVRLWRRGQQFNAAREIFAVEPAHLTASANVDRSSSPPRLWFIDRPGFFETIVHLGDIGGPKRRLDLPLDAEYLVHGDFLAIKLRTPWTVANVTHASDTVLGCRVDEVLDGSPRVHILFEPSERRSVKHMFWAGDRLIESLLDDLRPRFASHRGGPEGWTELQLTGLPADGVVHIERLDSEPAESNGDLLVTLQDPLTPASLLFAERGQALRLLKRGSAVFDAAGAVVTRHEAISSDGERIPYVQVGPPAAGGDAPVLMYGYGGFEVMEEPSYRSAVGKLWLEKGGTFVLTHIRGGGEFGTRWHEAGKRAGKALAHDDFAAIAAHLVERGVTSPKRIAAEGGSNGGLLVTNMLTRYPERFGALFCTIPLIDMRRYSKLLAGASWIAEYGDPDKPEDWAFLQHLSAYHTALPGRGYPPILIATSRKDDRVHPGHARKMAAKLVELGYHAWFYEPAAGGHGYGKDNRERATFTALGYAFLRRMIGWEEDAVK